MPADPPIADPSTPPDTFDGDIDAAAAELKAAHDAIASLAAANDAAASAAASASAALTSGHNRISSAVAAINQVIAHA